jgi:hypothetical protein
MKWMILLACAVVPLAGCASNKGGTNGEQPDYGAQSNIGGQAHPEPRSSPTFRPGLNPEDPRSSQFTNRPQPNQVPSQAPP